MDTSADTIAAIATAPGEAAIAIVRVAGPQSLTIADHIFRCAHPPPSQRKAGTFIHGFVRPGNDTFDKAPDVDEALLLIFRAPSSYTREDAIEIQGHGGLTRARMILRTVLAAGARVAQPGEFTRRAFLNGRIDLVQAEAVADIIKAQSDRAARAAMEQLEGSLSTTFTKLYDMAVEISSEIEYALDFSEDELLPDDLAQPRQRAEDLLTAINSVLATWDEGRLLRQGATVVISGQPNVGKSTLLNLLLGTERAIVSDIPGTTRDTIEEPFVLDGIPVRLVDTAGLRTPACPVEQAGIRRAQQQIQQADLNIHVVDASREVDADERRRLAALPETGTLIILNKTDLGERLAVRDLPPAIPRVRASLLDDPPLGVITRAMRERLGDTFADAPHAAIGERHRETLAHVCRDVAQAARLLDGSEQGLLPAANLLRAAAGDLGTVTGRTYSNDLLERVFSHFCVGK